MNATKRVADLEARGKTAVYVKTWRGRLPAHLAIDPEIVDHDGAGHPVYVARDGYGHYRCVIRDLKDFSVSRLLND